MRKKQKIILILITCLLLILIIMGIMLGVMKKKVAKEYDIQLPNGNKELTEKDYYEYMENKIIPSKSFQLNNKYTGKTETSEFYKSVYILVNNLPKIVEDLNKIPESKSDEYFNNNKDLIYKSFGINQLDDFRELSTHLREFTNLGSYESSTLDTNEFITGNDYSKFKIKIKFSNLQEEIVLTTYFANRKEKSPSVIYKAE